MNSIWIKDWIPWNSSGFGIPKLQRTARASPAILKKFQLIGSRSVPITLPLIDHGSVETRKMSSPNFTSTSKTPIFLEVFSVHNLGVQMTTSQVFGCHPGKPCEACEYLNDPPLIYIGNKMSCLKMKKLERPERPRKKNVSRFESQPLRCFFFFLCFRVELKA